MENKGWMLRIKRTLHPSGRQPYHHHHRQQKEGVKKFRVNYTRREGGLTSSLKQQLVRKLPPREITYP